MRGRVLDIATLIAKHVTFGGLVLLTVIYLTHVGLDTVRREAIGTALVQGAEKTVTYAGRILRGDWGLSAAGSVTGRPVPITDVLVTTVPRSLGLVACSLLIAVPVGVTLGVMAAAQRRRWKSLLFLLASTIGVSVPSFFAAFLLQMAVTRFTQAFGWRLLPVGGFGWNAHLILPALVLAARPVAQVARITFASVSDTLDQDFVRTARSKGLREHRVLLMHSLRSAAIPVLTTIGVSLRFALCSLPVVEYFFGWPGAGSTLLRAIGQYDAATTIALLLCLAGMVLVVNLSLDLAYRAVDPRLRDRAPARVEHQPSMWKRILHALGRLGELLGSNPLRRKVTRSPPPRAAVPTLLSARKSDAHRAPRAEDAVVRGARPFAPVRAALRNLPLAPGIMLMVALIAAALMGPQLAPHSPYETRGLEYVAGKMLVPPFAPGGPYPWGTDPIGRDILSLILAGAQRTLFLAGLAVAARMLVGFSLGVVAGWLAGTWVDRALLAAAEIVASFPSLLLVMMIVLSLGIRQGLQPFMIALCVVGYGEIMQLVRAEVMGIRTRPFVESAIAVGAGTPRIVRTHLLPHLVASMVPLAALEMGAVLMLLSELGFIGIFIGGGAFAELEIWGAPFHYSDVPEWGSLLSMVRTYARSHPWMALYPSLAFFVSILAFNLFGEGMRRVLARGFVPISQRAKHALFVLAGLGLAAGIAWSQWGSVGALAIYEKQASVFDGEAALGHIEALTHETLAGRALGTPGCRLAAEYIATQFEVLGLQPAGELYTYFYARSRSFQMLGEVPMLILDPGEAQPVYRQDFVEYAGAYRNVGRGEGGVRILLTGELTKRYWPARGGDYYPALDEIGVSETDILLVLSGREADYLAELPCGGVLVVAGPGTDMATSQTLSPRAPHFRLSGPSRTSGQDSPKLTITETLADRILAGSGLTVAGLRTTQSGLDTDEIFVRTTEVTACLSVEGIVRDGEPTWHVIGHLPGRRAPVPGAEQVVVENAVIMILVQYDAPPPSPDDVPYPGANDNASGVAVMIEAIRVMQETGYQPYRTFLFVAYSGEGLEGGLDVTAPEAAAFLQAKYGFSSSLKVEAVVRLRGLGAGEGGKPSLVLETGGNERLARVFEDSARRMGVRTQREEDVVDLSVIFRDRSAHVSAQEAPEIGVSLLGWDRTSRRPVDTADAISAANLERAGRTLALALMVLGREMRY